MFIASQYNISLLDHLDRSLPLDVAFEYMHKTWVGYRQM